MFYLNKCDLNYRDGKELPDNGRKFYLNKCDLNNNEWITVDYEELASFI